MESTIANRFILVTLTVILFLGFSQTSAQTGAKVKTKPKAPPVSNNERKKIETIVREYLLKNPSVIREAMMALEAQEEEARQQNVAINLKKLKTEIYSDPDSPVAGQSQR